MYETFGHTADVGLRIRADSLDELFAEAAQALFSVILANPNAVRPAEPFRVRLSAQSPDELLHDWLAELLFLFDARRVVFGRFEVAVDQTGLSGTAWGEPLDPQRHQLEVEVKAVTYHGLRLERQDATWLAEVILDL